ncbi:MAG: hypothetical protein PF518_06645 [Spirochaetaceae bacterium]|nr:hypothetical protein [Spirochaetaceae bacterium]
MKDLDFWSTALVNHMEETGYQKKNDGRIFETDNGSKIFAIQWGLSLGNKDYLYMTAIVPYKKILYIIESAGEISAFNVYLESINEALESFIP